MLPPSLVCHRLRKPCLPVLLCLVFALGCETSERTTLHEDDHHQPAHWPTDLADAANKLEQRLGKFSEGESSSSGTPETFSELREILGWTPEVAADSRLTEAEWMPIYETSESLIASVQSPTALSNPKTIDEIYHLCTQLRDAAVIAQSRAPQSDEPTEKDESADSDESVATDEPQETKP